MHKRAIIFATVFMLSMIIRASAETLIQYTPTEDIADRRLDYILGVISLAMSKTQAQYGNYSFGHIPSSISLARSVHELNLNTYPNYFIPGGLNIKSMGGDNLATVDYPVYQGLLNYRICFVSPAAKAKVAQAKTLEDLKKFTIGQGVDWPDVAILTSNGFHVEQVTNYTSLFKMVMSNRVDLFCRGISELRKELHEYQNLGDLQFDESFAFHYEMPYLFYFNKNSQEAMTRIEAGLKMAQADGSLPKLFWRFYRDDIKFANLRSRKIYDLKNPADIKLSDAYKSYLVDPFNIQ